MTQKIVFCINFTKISILLKYAFARMKKNASADSKRDFELINLMVNHPHISPRMLKNIECKTLILEGERDVIKPSHTKLIAEKITGSQHEIVPKSGHNIFGDNPAFTNTLIENFIA